MYVYAEHPNTDLWCMAWAFDNDEPRIWLPSEPLPERVVQHIAAGGEIRAWNAAFERVMWRAIGTPRYAFPPVRHEQWVCSAAEAAAMALPRSLDQCASVLGVTQQKDHDGYALMLRMTRPRKVHDDGTIVWWTEPDRLARLYEYCKQDVRTERSIVHALRRLTPNERTVYLLDQTINDRGIMVDRPLVLAAQDIAEEAVLRANAALGELTGGLVEGVTQTGRLKTWLSTQGLQVESLAKAPMQELLESDLDPKVREALQLRADAGRTSIAKLASMLACACQDGRARGLLLYHGAATGRWSGRLIQPQNFPRGEVEAPEQYIADVLAGRYELLDLIAAPVVIVLSMLRGMLCAADGCDLIAADFAAIEARVLNWLAGQEDVLQMFRAYDRGDANMNPYKVMAVRMGRGGSVKDIKKPSDDYQAGKAAELGCGYQMGKKKFVDAAWKVYQLRVTPEQAAEAVNAYRQSHEQVKAFWYETETACLNAVRQPGVVQTFGARRNLKAIVSGAYLYIVLPSKRPLCYAAPREVKAEAPWSVENRREAREAGKPEPLPEYRQQLEYSGVDPISNQWGRLRAYGGYLVENIVQAVSRDLLAEAMLRVEPRGYATLLSVHDEIVCEVPQGEGSLAEFTALMAQVPDWAAGCPIAVEGWRGARYRK